MTTQEEYTYRFISEVFAGTSPEFRQHVMDNLDASVDKCREMEDVFTTVEVEAMEVMNGFFGKCIFAKSKFDRFDKLQPLNQ